MVVSKWWLFDTSIDLNERIVFDKGHTIQHLYTTLTPAQVRAMRWHLYWNKDSLEPIQMGSYIFSGHYTPDMIVQQLNEGPVRVSERVTILEWRSIYDIDRYLVSKGYAVSGDYIAYVSDSSNIQMIAKKYPFVQSFLDSKPESRFQDISLEGLLYPDTYNINPNQAVIELVSLQLKAFQEKVAKPYQSQIDAFSSSLQEKWFSFSLWWYNIVTLASIIEKEERNNTNKPIIAGIFLNRIQSDMRIDADITLCYGLKTGYESCTPSLIVKSIADANNVYNTRVHKGLTPTPIANPSATTFKALLNFTSTNYYYYLHGSDGSIHYGATLDEHNSNKKYL